jgi:hypothetical protein
MLNMLSDTNVVPARGMRPARCPLPILFGLIALGAPLFGQAKPGHFYHINYYQVRPGEEKAYDSALVGIVTPVFDEMVKRKAIVSYLLLSKVAGSGEYTNIVVVEVATLSAAEGIFQRDLDSASQALLHKSWNDATVQFPNLRRFMHAELYTAAGRGP